MNRTSALHTFSDLHKTGCFVLPNPWDIGSAVYLQQVGFKALATTSAGFAFSRGLPDSVTAIPVELMLEHVREIAGATALPVNADFQNCYADLPEGVQRNVTRCIETGVAGLSIEDATGNARTPLYDEKLAVERVRAARAAIDAAGVAVILTARCEAALVRYADALPVALERLVAFAEAGADCLYAPGFYEPDEISAIVKAVAPKPVNVLARPGLTVSQLAGLGVRRISVGSSLARVAWGAFMRSAQEIATAGSFATFAEGAAHRELNELFGG
jgi:2-methylisocitrate lyase-like PEP mutase family enzyme